MIWTRAWWQGAGERAIKTLLQTFVAVVTVDLGAKAVGVTAGITDVSWLSDLSIAGLAAILSLATSVGNAQFTAGSPAPTPDAGADAALAKHATDT